MNTTAYAGTDPVKLAYYARKGQMHVKPRRRPTPIANSNRGLSPKGPAGRSIHCTARIG